MRPAVSACLSDPSTSDPSGCSAGEPPTRAWCHVDVDGNQEQVNGARDAASPVHRMHGHQVFPARRAAVVRADAIRAVGGEGDLIVIELPNSPRGDHGSTTKRQRRLRGEYLAKRVEMATLVGLQLQTDLLEQGSSVASPNAA